MRKRLWLKLFWLMVLTALVVAGCDSSDNDGGGPVAEPAPGPAATLTVSGQAVDDPVAGADVMVKNLSGRLLGAGVTDAEGYYAVTVLRSDAEAGYSIEVSGGTVADAPFSGTLRADYGPGDDPGAANVTPLTSLVSVAAENGAGDSALQRRDAAVEMIENIGMVREGEWMKTAPGFVDMAALRPFIAQMGFDEWVQGMAGDLEDGELSQEMMVGFPHAHGGIRDAGLAGGGGEVEMGPGGNFSGRVDAAAPEGASLRYELVNAPAGMRVDESGEIAYAVPADAPAGSRIPFAVRVSDPETGFGRVVHGAIVIPPEGTVPAVDADGDGVAASDGDCNDADAAIYPGAEEICGDGIDQDCDGADKACPGGSVSTWYKDADGDGYSDGTTQEAPEKPEGYGAAESLTGTSGDCNDADAAIRPGAEEVCGDGIDQDCDGADAECSAEMITWYKDADNDGYSDGTTQEAAEQPEGYSKADALQGISGDCNDSNAGVYPGAADICGDGVDQDCNGYDETCYVPPPPVTDTTPPTVTSTVPEDDAVDVLPEVVVIADFSEEMDGTTVTTGSLKLLDGEGNPVAGSVTYSDRKAVFTPDEPLAYESDYTVQATSVMRDGADNPLTAKSWSFRTSTIFERANMSPYVYRYVEEDSRGNRIAVFVPADFGENGVVITDGVMPTELGPGLEKLTNDYVQIQAPETYEDRTQVAVNYDTEPTEIWVYDPEVGAPVMTPFTIAAEGLAEFRAEPVDGRIQFMLLRDTAAERRAGTTDVPRKFEVVYDEDEGGATIKYDSEDPYYQFIRYRKKDTDSGQWQEWVMKNRIEGAGLYQVYVWGEKEFETVVLWRQIVYIPYPKPEGIDPEELAWKYLPIAVFHDEESYFPRRYEDILSFGAGQGVMDVGLKTATLQKDKKLLMGQELTDFMTYNGHMDYYFNFGTLETVCEGGLYFNAKACGSAVLSPLFPYASFALCTPVPCRNHFLRSFVGDSSKPVAYYDLTIRFIQNDYPEF